MDFKEAAREIQEEIVSWRRGLHRIPELSFELHRTSCYIKNKLAGMGLTCQVMAKTGIVALIEGCSPGPVIALRADMDGLTVKEETGLPFASVNDNMHACGHDAHMAMLLGAAKLLVAEKHRLRGSVKLIFQPAEESGGGADAMLREGCLENPKVEAALALHIGRIFPEVGTGQIGVGRGVVMAASTPFSVTVKGRQTHCSKPQAGADPITAAAQMIMALQTIISRELNPSSPAVLSITSIRGGNALNIIPETVIFRGDIRTVDPSDQQFIKERIREICSSIAAAGRAEAAVEFMGSFPPTINDASFTQAFAKSAVKIVGEKQIVELSRPDMGNEDFSLFLQKVPGTYFFLGSHNLSKETDHPHHNPKFDIDESVLWIGAAVLAQAAFDYCSGW